jgi:hypothetical protein
MLKPLITYLNKPDLKAALLIEIAKHEAADQLVKGHYGEMNGQFTGCAIGCSLHSLNLLQGKIGKANGEDAFVGRHDRFPTELGWPLWLAYYEDSIFEGLPQKLAETWPRRLADAVPVGITIPDTVLADLQVWWLTHERFGVRNVTESAEVRGWIDIIAAFIRADSRGEATGEQRETADKAARAARDAWAAWDAWAARAAWAARDARAAWVARAAWDARAWAARDAWAAWDARDAWDARAARAARVAWAARVASIRDDFYPALSEYLLSLLRTLERPSLESRAV